jgi:methylmalonyl-CoA/ethylmalonyl-CoA epimerase
MPDANTRDIGGIKLPEINHVGLVVRNRDEALRRYQQSLGIGPFEMYDRRITNMTVRGEPAPPCTLRLGFANLGTILFEVIEPVEGPSIVWKEFLDQHGEGLHHLGFVVPDLEGDLMKLQANGLRVLLESPVPGRGKIAYVEGEAAGGVLWELIQDSPGTQEFYERLWVATRR